MADIQQHFSSVAANYRHLRTTDSRPVHFIHQQLHPRSDLRGADVGCGTGRYSMVLYEHLGPKLFLYCIDGNRDMLRQLTQIMHQHHIENFEPIHGFGRCLPLRDASLDFISTFNAIHHFQIVDFLNEAVRTLKDGGRVFVYTRTRSQNSRNIWGRYFPFFARKETRLFEEEEFAGLVHPIGNLELERIASFEYEREDSLEGLVEKARGHHYSTFCLYSAEELDAALSDFQRNLGRAFDDPGRITWVDENTLFVLRKRPPMHAWAPHRDH